MVFINKIISIYYLKYSGGGWKIGNWIWDLISYKIYNKDLVLIMVVSIMNVKIVICCNYFVFI